MGSMALSNHYRSEDLLDVETAAGGFQQRKGMRQCLPLTFCFHTGLSQYLALNATEGRNLSDIFYHCPVSIHNPLSTPYPPDPNNPLSTPYPPDPNNPLSTPYSPDPNNPLSPRP